MKTKIQNSVSIGVDLAKSSFDVALAPQGVDLDQWRRLPHLHIDYPPDSHKGVKAFVRWVREHVETSQCERIVVESTGQMSRRFAAAVDGRQLPQVAIVNPARTKSFISSLGIRDKTDRIDAAGLALFAAIHRPKPTPAPSPAELNLRGLTRLRESFLGDLTAWKNRLGEAEGQPQQTTIKATIKHLEKQVLKIEAQIERQIAADPTLSRQVKAIKQIKGLKQVSATTMTAELGDLAKYKRNELVSAGGLYPRERMSGTSVRSRPRMVKGGGARVRRVLYMGAMSLFRSKGPLRDTIDRFQAQGVPDMVIIGMMMRKLLLIARAVVRNNGVYDPSRIATVCA